MRFNYQNRAQSEGRVKCETCSLPMLGVGEQDPRTWHHSTLFDKTFCECPESKTTEHLEVKIIKETCDKLYGPKFCPNCNKTQPVKVYKLQGSDFTKFEGYTLTVGFTGARVCSVCLKAIE